MTKKVSGIPTSALEIEAFEAFAASGETTGLLVLADACDAGEEGVGKPRPHFAALLRAVAGARNPAVHWFYVNGDRSYRLGVESERQGYLRGAAQSAWFEARSLDHVNSGTWRYRWEQEGDAEGWGEPGGGSLWYCILEEIVPAERPWQQWQQLPSWRHLTSLGGIDLGPDSFPPGVVSDPNPYCRVVAAQIAQDVLSDRPDVVSQVPAWMALETPVTTEIGVPRWATLYPRGTKELYHHTIAQDKLIIILPCVPPGELIDDETVYGKTACRAYFLHNGIVQETRYPHAAFMKHTLRWHPMGERGPYEELAAALRARHIVIAYSEFAPKGHRKTHAARRAQMRRDAIPF